MTLGEVISAYVALRQAMGQKFTSDRAVLQAFGRAMGSDRAVQEVDPERVRAFLGSPAMGTWHRRRCTLTGFYRYAVSRGHVPASPLPTTVPKRSPPFVPYVYTQDDLRRLLEATASYRKTHRLLEPHTFRAILLVLYGAGLRISEALALRLADVDFAEAVLLVRATKFYKSRLVPLGTHLHTALAHYATARRHGGAADGPDGVFFVGRTGRPLTIHTLQQSFRQLRAYAGIRRAAGAR
jgi:integrase/recombinase XerD